MSPKPKQKWTLLVVSSMAFLLLSLPAQAQPVRRPLAEAWKKLTVLSDSVVNRIGDLFLGLWQAGAVKEGTSIDPDGSPHSADPQGTSSEEGTSIDPNGKP